VKSLSRAEPLLDGFSLANVEDRVTVANHEPHDG
jgi:hypothetical protein